ncbi:MAG: phage baseplate assembly protein [Ruminococcus sp.]|nr:phage baseplate assembly protein [Ruminococcus sp.]
MWILNYVTQNSLTPSLPEKGRVKGSVGSKVQVDASSDFGQINVVSPYGIAYVPPVGEQSVVINADGENFCLGTVAPTKRLQAGEIMLFSAGGASIELKNDGNVYINGKKVG